MRKALLHLNHILIKSLLNENSIVLDMTLGHGHDTYMIAPYVKKVYAFDIQKAAISSAQSLLSNASNVTLIHDSFKNYEKYVTHFNLVIFNLGYLPKGDKSMTTTKDDTLSTINDLIQHHPSAQIIVMSYVGHIEGLEEYKALEEYFKTLETHHVVKSSRMSDLSTPVLFWIYKK
jgi:SAM-dependent methyltransferase